MSYTSPYNGKIQRFTEYDLLITPKTAGNYYVCTDSRKMYYDKTSTHRVIVVVTMVNTEVDRIYNIKPSNGVSYYVWETNELWLYNAGWEILIGELRDNKGYYYVDGKFSDLAGDDIDGNGLMKDGSVIVRDINKIIKGKVYVDGTTNELNISSFLGGGLNLLPNGSLNTTLISINTPDVTIDNPTEVQDTTLLYNLLIGEPGTLRLNPCNIVTDSVGTMNVRLLGLSILNGDFNTIGEMYVNVKSSKNLDDLSLHHYKVFHEGNFDPSKMNALQYNSPAFTGVPTSPTPLLTSDTDQVATTKFVKNQKYLGFKADLDIEDLDTVNVTGMYFQMSSEINLIGLNYPVAGSGVLTVYNDGFGTIRQSYVCFNNNRTYARVNYVDGFCSWEKTITLSDVPTDKVLSVSGKIGDVQLVKADVGLGNVNNTLDTAKPVSTLQQAALNLKANYLKWDGYTIYNKWSRILEMRGASSEGYSFMLSVSLVRGTVSSQTSFIVTGSRNTKCSIKQLNTTADETFKIRSTIDINGYGFIELFDNMSNPGNVINQLWSCSITDISSNVGHTTYTAKTTPTDGTTLQASHSVKSELTIIL